MDGLPLADTLDEILAGRLLMPIAFNSAGTRLWYQVWTGTTAAGVVGGENPAYDAEGNPVEIGTCGDWTEEEGVATQGSNTHGGVQWTDFTVTECGNAGSLFCFGVDRNSALEFEPASGRIAFVSQGLFDPGTGIEEADALCQAEAAALDGTFLAVLGTSSESAASRFDLDGEPWVRPDGVPFVHQAADLVDENALLTFLNVQADGEVVASLESGDTYALTGGPFGMTPEASQTCEDWSDGGTSGRVLMGNPQGAYDNGASCCSGGCLDARRIFCLEE
jgi:hypothetical protein